MSTDQGWLFEERLQAVRSRRKASRISKAISLTLWTAGLTAVVIVVGVGLLDFH